MTFEPGDSVGAYSIESKLGAGVFTTDYRAAGPDSSPVVLKVLGLNHSREAITAAAFTQAASAIQSMKSPHLVTITDVGQTSSGQPYLVRQATDRGMLIDRVRLGRPGNDDDLCRVASALATGLSDMHRKGAVHGDLRIGTVLLDSGKAVNNVTFGLLWEDDVVLIGEPVVFPREIPATIEFAELDSESQMQVGIEADIRAAGQIVAEVALGRCREPEESLSSLFSALSGADRFELASVLAAGPGPEPVDARSARRWAERVSEAIQPAEKRPARELTIGQSVRVTLVTAVAVAASVALGGVVLGMSEASPLRAVEAAFGGGEPPTAMVDDAGAVDTGAIAEDRAPDEMAPDEMAPDELAYRELPPSNHEECLHQADEDHPLGLGLGEVTHASVEIVMDAATSDREIAANGSLIGQVAKGETNFVIDALRPDSLYVFGVFEPGAIEGATTDTEPLGLVCAQTFFAPEPPRPERLSDAGPPKSAPGTKVITLD